MVLNLNFLKTARYPEHYLELTEWLQNCSMGLIAGIYHWICLSKKGRGYSITATHTYATT